MSIKLPRKLLGFGNAAFELCNNWRDTMYSSTLVGYYGLSKILGIETMLGHTVAIEDVIVPILFRESCRLIAHDGPNTSNGRAVGVICTTITMGFSLDLIAKNINLYGGAAAFLIGAYSLTCSGVGPKVLPKMIREAAKRYGDTLWDYPRKIKPPRQRNFTGKLAPALGSG